MKLTIADLKPFLPGLEDALNDEAVSEVMINGPAAVFVERAGRMAALEVPSLTAEAVARAAVQIARPLGKEPLAEPVIDAAAGGHRFDTTLPTGVTPQARDSWARARERGNVVSVTVLSVPAAAVLSRHDGSRTRRRSWASALDPVVRSASRVTGNAPARSAGRAGSAAKHPARSAPPYGGPPRRRQSRMNRAVHPSGLPPAAHSDPALPSCSS